MPATILFIIGSLGCRRSGRLCDPEKRFASSRLAMPLVPPVFLDDTTTTQAQVLPFSLKNGQDRRYAAGSREKSLWSCFLDPSMPGAAPVPESRSIARPQLLQAALSGASPPRLIYGKRRYLGRSPYSRGPRRPGTSGFNVLRSTRPWNFADRSTDGPQAWAWKVL